jgi:hypothetical protein
MRSRDDLDSRLTSAQRTAEVNDNPALNLHLRRLLKRARYEDLEKEWRVNSTRLDLIGYPGRRRFLRPDLRLRRAALRQRTFVARCACWGMLNDFLGIAQDAGSGASSQANGSPRKFKLRHYQAFIYTAF